MQFTMSELSQSVIYKLLTATVTPRPIAWVTSCNNQGHLNAAPFSFFNMMGSAPPLAVFCVSKSELKHKKDTIDNILDMSEFVVNLVPFSLVSEMNLTAMEAPAYLSELEIAGLETLPSTQIKVPQIAKAPVSFECVNHATMMTGPSQYMVIGRVVAMRVDDAYVLDAQKGYIDSDNLNLIGRMGGRGTYVKTTDLFQLDRINYDTWKDQREN